MYTCSNHISLYSGSGALKTQKYVIDNIEARKLLKRFCDTGLDTDMYHKLLGFLECEVIVIANFFKYIAVFSQEVWKCQAIFQRFLTDLTTCYPASSIIPATFDARNILDLLCSVTDLGAEPQLLMSIQKMNPTLHSLLTSGRKLPQLMELIVPVLEHIYRIALGIHNGEYIHQMHFMDSVFYYLRDLPLL